MRRSSAWLLLAIALLLALLAAVLYATPNRAHRARVSFLDVGQGDAIFIEAPSGAQILIDGGADSSLLRQLPTVMPWYDRTIDLVVATHPDNDHIGGLIDLLPRYAVANVLVPSTLADTHAWNVFLSEVGKEKTDGARIVTAERGTRISFGDSYLEVLFPDRLLPGVETNTGCIVTRYVYRDTSFMLPCDTPGDVERYLAVLEKDRLHADVLKAAHHGSKNSSSPLFVGYVDPAYGVYSRGCDNTYGHPAEHTKETFARFNIQTFDTCTDGTVTFVSDGSEVTKN